MDDDFPLAASLFFFYQRLHLILRSYEWSCQLYKSSLQCRNHFISHSFLFFPLFFKKKSHRYPEQHDKNNNALFTGQYIVTVQLSLAVDLWICLLGFIHLTVWFNLRGQKKVLCHENNPLQQCPWTALQSEFKQFLSMWLHYMLNSYHCTDC